jgi:hypothetical protein
MILETLFYGLRSRGSRDGESLPNSNNWDTTTDNKPVFNFGYPFCVPGPMGPETGTICPKATTGTLPWTTSMFLILETPDVHDSGNPVCVPSPVGPETGTAPRQQQLGHHHGQQACF